jgi:hypothetical protein
VLALACLRPSAQSPEPGGKKKEKELRPLKVFTLENYVILIPRIFSLIISKLSSLFRKAFMSSEDEFVF